MASKLQCQLHQITENQKGDETEQNKNKNNMYPPMT